MKKSYVSPFSLVLELSNRESLLLTASPGAGRSADGSNDGNYKPGMDIEAPTFSFSDELENSEFKKSNF